MDMRYRFVESVTFFHIKVLIILVRQLGFVLAPDRHHAVHRLLFRIRLVFAFAAFLRPAARDVHFDRVTDEIGIFLHDRLQPVFLEVFVVLIVFGVLFDLQNNVCADLRLLARLNRISVSPPGLPLIGFIRAQRPADDGNHVRDHERGIEAHAKLPDDVMAVLQLILVLECKRAAVGDNA
ncbi:hypothetical protein D3C81_904950 [compost metagenome]